MESLGFIRTAVITPVCRVGDPVFNGNRIIRCMKAASQQGAGLLLFPELALTGYTCGDLFRQDLLYEKNLQELQRVAEASRGLKSLIVLGCFIRQDGRSYNCAAVIQNGEILGIVPKLALSPKERRCFSAGRQLCRRGSVRIGGKAVPAGFLLFHDEAAGLVLGVELGTDRDASPAPAELLTAAGAQIILNPSAEPTYGFRPEELEQSLLAAGRRYNCAYLCASAGVFESSGEQVYGGQSLIVERQSVLARAPLFARRSSVTVGEINYLALRSKQGRALSPGGPGGNAGPALVALEPLPLLLQGRDRLTRRYPRNPFLPEKSSQVKAYCRRVFRTQTAGLARRLSHLNCKALLGISGGLDSTLALLVAAAAMESLDRPASDVLAVTMPGFGTGSDGYRNAVSLMRVLGVNSREISIKQASLQHFRDIGHDPGLQDVTYENTQARERTQILLDLANQEGGMVVGTGDLSEDALGWCTFGGDQLAMYNVNASIPKTLIPYLLLTVASDPKKAGLSCADPAALHKVLEAVIAMPISPELLPPDAAGRISQKTEESIGPYALHDFFLYHTLETGVSPARLCAMAERSFEGVYAPDEIRKWLRTFYKRFLNQQYKRSSGPEGPQAGPVSLSPRGSLDLAGDLSPELWLREMQEL